MVRVTRFHILVLAVVAAGTLLPVLDGEAFAAPASGASPTGLAVWRSGTLTTPEYNLWNGSGFGTAAMSAAVGQWSIIAGAASPTRRETILLGIDPSGTVTGEMWNGASWTALAFNPLAHVSEYSRWGCAVAYEGLSGDAILVWNNGTYGSTGLSYRVWNGTAWSSAQTITTPLASEPKQIRLAADPNSDEMVLVVSNYWSQDYALVWNGSAWGSSRILSSSDYGDDLNDVCVA
ncbi:MAG TPA: hypothetical protein VMU02_11940, partial [bacterium]|nr:hypothetical protein [bacterium]